MDFANLDGLLCSDNTSNHNNSLISAYDLDPIPKSHGFKLLDKKPLSASAPTLKEDDFSKGMLMLLQQQRSNCTSVFSDSQNMNMNMLSFSSPNREWNSPFPYCSRDTTTSTGYGVRGMLAGVKGPFTPSQWMELEHQALIYKYITINAPIPTNLLIPIRKALETAAFCSYPATNLRHTTYGWGGFHVGFSNSSDPEPGRCRRTDGKKWRCSRDAVADQKYCERHMNRGRHRSRKPVEPPPTTTTNTSAAVAAAVSVPATVITTANAAVISHLKQQNQNHLNRSFIKSEKIQDSTGLKQPAISIPSEFGFVSSDSLLNPLQKPNNGDQKPQNSLHQFIDDWPHPDRTQLSISIPMSSPDFISSNSSPISKPLNFSPLRMGLGVCNTTAHNLFGEMSQPANRIPVSWETSSGGPLGEVLNHNANNSPSALNLMTNGWENSHQQMALSPTGVLQKTGFGCFSNSSAGSSPRTDNSLLGSTLITSSLPLL